MALRKTESQPDGKRRAGPGAAEGLHFDANDQQGKHIQSINAVPRTHWVSGLAAGGNQENSSEPAFHPAWFGEEE